MIQCSVELFQLDFFLHFLSTHEGVTKTLKLHHFPLTRVPFHPSRTSLMAQLVKNLPAMLKTLL